MAKKHNDGYLSAKESRRISKENRKITNALEKKRKRKNVPESEYLTEMHDPNNAVEFDNLHTYFFTDTGVVKSVDGVSFEVPIGKTVGVVAGANSAVDNVIDKLTEEGYGFLVASLGKAERVKELFMISLKPQPQSCSEIKFCNFQLRSVGVW